MTLYEQVGSFRYSERSPLFDYSRAEDCFFWILFEKLMVIVYTGKAMQTSGAYAPRGVNMSLLTPKYRFNRISDIPISFFFDRQIEGLILDVDNTLTTHDNPEPAAGVLQWLNRAREAGLRMVILSNNSSDRVQPFAELLDLEFEADGKKPAIGGVVRACRHIATPPSRTAMIGDQIFTDILGGNRAGLLTVFVDPIQPEAGWFFRLKRWCERFILR